MHKGKKNSNVQKQGESIKPKIIPTENNFTRFNVLWDTKCTYGLEKCYSLVKANAYAWECYGRNILLICITKDV